MEKNLTTGSAGRQLIGFSLPYLLSYLLQTPSANGRLAFAQNTLTFLP